MAINLPLPAALKNSLPLAVSCLMPGKNLVQRPETSQANILQVQAAVANTGRVHPVIALWLPGHIGFLAAAFKVAWLMQLSNLQR